REDHLRYLVKCGVIHPVVRTNADTFFAFGDVAIIKQANDDLAGQASFRAVARNLIASRLGQLAFDFRLDAAPAKILTLQLPAAESAVRRRALLPGGHVREDGAVAGGQAALEGVPGARAARGMGGVGEGVL